MSSVLLSQFLTQPEQWNIYVHLLNMFGTVLFGYVDIQLGAICFRLIERPKLNIDFVFNCPECSFYMMCCQVLACVRGLLSQARQHDGHD